MLSQLRSWRYGLVKKRRLLFTIVCSLAIAQVPACQYASGARTDPVVANSMGRFYESFLHRRLTSSEVREISDEFIRIHSSEGKDRTAIHKIARSFDPHTKVLRDGKTPAAILTRHLLIEANYFRPVMKGTIELRLLTEPDPVVVADFRSRQLMTARDVTALSNLRTFASSRGAPVEKALTPAEFRNAVAQLNATYIQTSQRMPRFPGEAAAYWAGIRQNWSRLTVDERDLARLYVEKTWKISMPASMFQKLLGLNERAAFFRHAQEERMRIGKITLDAGNLPYALDGLITYR